MNGKYVIRNTRDNSFLKWMNLHDVCMWTDHILYAQLFNSQNEAVEVATRAKRYSRYPLSCVVEPYDSDVIYV